MAGILSLLVIFLAAFGIDRLVHAILPGHPDHPVTHTGTSVPAQSRTTTPATRPAGAAPAGSNPVSLSAVGDLELGTTGDLPPHPGRYLHAVKSALAAPIVFGNLEGTLSTATASRCSPAAIDCVAFADPPSYARFLLADGFTVLNSANDHFEDFGRQGVTQTSAALKSAGIVQAGLPGQIGVVTDGATKVAFVDFAPYNTTNDLLDLPVAPKLIKRAETLAPVVIVYMNAGTEGATADHVTGGEEYYQGQDRGDPEAFAKAAIDDGASAVIASGPHVLRGMQFYKGHLIDYSLGDFAGYDNFATDGNLGLSGILHLTLSDTGAFVKGSWTSLRLNATGQPAVDRSRTAARFVNALSREDFGSAAAIIGGGGAIRPVSAPGPSSSATTTPAATATPAATTTPASATTTPSSATTRPATTTAASSATTTPASATTRPATTTTSSATTRRASSTPSTA